MRRLLLVLAVLAGWNSAQAAPTFHWSLQKLECGSALQMRGNSSQCLGTYLAKRFLVVAYPGKRLSVIRYKGETTKSGEEWTAEVALTGKPIVVVREQVAVIGAVDGDVVKVVTIDANGKASGAVTIAKGVSEIQLESDAQGLRAYARKPDGSGQVIDLDPATLKATASEVPAAAIRTTQDKTAQPANGEARDGGLHISWDAAALVLHAGKASAKLVDDDRFRMQLVTMHASGDRVLVTLHHPAASGTNVFAFDATTGAKLWAMHVTGIGVVAHSAYFNKVSAKRDGDLLVVQGVEAGGAFVCTVAIKDGEERACVDGLGAAAIFDPPPPTTIVKAVPRARPLGPQTTSMKCKRTSSPKSALVLKPWKAGDVVGTITSPSASCKPKLFGGIAGERIEITVYEADAAAVCECTIGFRQETNKDSRTVTAKRLGVELGRATITP